MGMFALQSSILAKGMVAKAEDSPRTAPIDTATWARRHGSVTPVDYVRKTADVDLTVLAVSGVRRKAELPEGIEVIRAWFEKRHKEIVALLPPGAYDDLALKLFGQLTPAEREAAIR